MDAHVEFVPFRVHYSNKSYVWVNGKKLFGCVSTATIFIINRHNRKDDKR